MKTKILSIVTAAVLIGAGAFVYAEAPKGASTVTTTAATSTPINEPAAVEQAPVTEAPATTATEPVEQVTSSQPVAPSAPTTPAPAEATNTTTYAPLPAPAQSCGDTPAAQANVCTYTGTSASIVFEGSPAP